VTNRHQLAGFQTASQRHRSHHPAGAKDELSDSFKKEQKQYLMSFLRGLLAPFSRSSQVVRQALVSKSQSHASGTWPHILASCFRCATTRTGAIDLVPLFFLGVAGAGLPDARRARTHRVSTRARSITPSQQRRHARAPFACVLGAIQNYYLTFPASRPVSNGLAASLGSLPFPASRHVLCCATGVSTCML
jgi:hypothetical protein